jgi:hypothetical protein
MVHYLLVKMISQMVLTLLVKKTTLVTLDMLVQLSKMTRGVLFTLVQIMFFYQSFWFEKPRILVV